jgi:RimJ/RimL family protein N-acetyltransferase
MLSPRSGTLMVVDLEGNLAGTISYRINMFAPNDGSKGYDIGISLHKDYRGKGYGAEAQRLITEYLFETYPVVRVSASTDVNNIAEQRSLEKAGFKREGVLRQIMWRKGAYRDMVVYSLLRHEL